MTAPLRIGTRASALALAQTTAWAESLGLPEGGYELVRITSEGDRSSASLATLGGTGVFVSALRDALLDGRVDAIVHSFKDLPTAPAPGIDVVAVPPREDARDALVAAGGLRLEGLPEGAAVGTGSPRRRAQLRRRRPDLEVVDIRGNVDTRLGRVLDPTVEEHRRLDAVVLAAAGLARLGREAVVTEHLELSDWPSAPAQGALAVEMRSDADAEQRAAVALTDDADARLAADLEREVLRILEAGCAAPLGVTAVVDDGAGTVSVRASVYALDGSDEVTVTASADRPEAGGLGERIARDLLAAGAAELAPLGAARG
ncbi:hydroxymethylbilane synthase [Serinibacter arcticus]|uniref:Hydroxymethylbilane synthase n=1 Tax=Serinibacter arcticus TaxID=1655435 RepID=A0A4Z1E4T5_9MICO|nr:hydroxymethylbilane synthase [Serinibacter arcticus]TGO04641.1 Porphobilinogen deaminase [Serinibacter arcticus]